MYEHLDKEEIITTIRTYLSSNSIGFLVHELPLSQSSIYNFKKNESALDKAQFSTICMLYAKAKQMKQKDE